MAQNLARATGPVPGQLQQPSLDNSIRGLIGELRNERNRVHFDINGAMKGLNLDDLGSKCLPTSAVIDPFMHKLAKLKERTGRENPFAYFDVGEFLPDWANVTPNLEVEPEDRWDQLAGRVQAETGRRSRSLDMLQWSIATDYQALFMAAAKMMSLSAAWAHKRVCMEVAG